MEGPEEQIATSVLAANGSGLFATELAVRGMDVPAVGKWPQTDRPGSPAFGRIATLESLREHLQWAIELEHATLPSYLCALYSLDPARNSEAAEVVCSVFVEEMLHMTLAANLLNAVGGRPQFDTPRMLPSYPRYLPHGDRSFEVSLVPFGPEALELFLRIEQPSRPGAPAESDEYETIGQFYEAIGQGLRELCAHFGEASVFCGDPARQVTDALFPGGRRVIAVDSLATALAALQEIVEQGEGAARRQVWDGDRDMFHPEREEVAHYYRFQQLKFGRRYRRGDTPQSGPTGDAISVDWDGVRPMRRNPRTTDHAPGSPIRIAQEEFNHTYCAVLHLLEQAFNGSPRMLAVATGAMHGLKAQAQALMQNPTADGLAMAGPTFEYVAPEDRRWSTGDTRRIVVLPNGPYLAYGQIPLRRKRKLVSEQNNALTWQKTATLPTEETYALCRCGRSGVKPFCDGTHADGAFDGTETADPRPYTERQRMLDADGISVRRVGGLCIHAAFCVGRAKEIPAMLEDAHDSDVRAHVMALIDRCPSGSYTYAIDSDGEAIEPDLPQAISITEEERGLASSIWVTGGIPIHRADGQPLETRNRVTLCRCGQSTKKPLCDGTHRTIGFREES
jgi:CDGSH-type Zn-finger protein